MCAVYGGSCALSAKTHILSVLRARAFYSCVMFALSSCCFGAHILPPHHPPTDPPTRVLRASQHAAPPNITSLVSRLPPNGKQVRERFVYIFGVCVVCVCRCSCLLFSVYLYFQCCCFVGHIFRQNFLHARRQIQKNQSRMICPNLDVIFGWKTFCCRRRCRVLVSQCTKFWCREQVVFFLFFFFEINKQKKQKLNNDNNQK